MGRSGHKPNGCHARGAVPIPSEKPGRPPDRGAGDLIIESVRLGNTVKVTVIDPRTLIEAAIVGPAHAGEHTLVQTAIRKLTYLRTKALGTKAKR